MKDVFGHVKGRKMEFGSKLCEGMVFNAVLQKHLLPKEAADVAPTVHLMEKMLEAKEKAQPADKSRLNHSIGYQESGKEDDASEGENAMPTEIKTMADVLHRIESIPTDNQQSWAIRESFLRTFNRFREEFSETTPEHFFGEEDGLLTHRSNNQREYELSNRNY